MVVVSHYSQHKSFVKDLHISRLLQPRRQARSRSCRLPIISSQRWWTSCPAASPKQASRKMCFSCCTSLLSWKVSFRVRCLSSSHPRAVTGRRADSLELRLSSRGCMLIHTSSGLRKPQSAVHRSSIPVARVTSPGEARNLLMVDHRRRRRLRQTCALLCQMAGPPTPSRVLLFSTHADAPQVSP